MIEDDAAQTACAPAVVRRESAAERCLVNRVVLCEVVWVPEAAYRDRREQIGEAIHALLLSDDLVIEDRDVVRSALYAFRTSWADFSDCLLGMSNGGQGCARTLTFDRRAVELDAFELI